MSGGSTRWQDRVRTLALGAMPPPTSQLPSVPADAPREQHELRSAAERIILEQDDFVSSQRAVTSTISPEDIAPVVEQLRERWIGWEHEERPARVALAVFQGLAEQCMGGELDLRKLAFFERNLPRVLEKRVDAAALENEARGFGLPVCDRMRHVTAVSANFGYVEKIVDHEARVILLDCEDRERVGDVTVPLVWLPMAYSREGAGVAWVEREYAAGVKGRFEPASAGK